ncbi:MAG: hypothetical protein EOO72_12530 [Myxococcaceae bacterium]|nr:MAG: hypothetical protein EOO72_12530 [Myxococcaceae bacterium]
MVSSAAKPWAMSTGVPSTEDADLLNSSRVSRRTRAGAAALSGVSSAPPMLPVQAEADITRAEDR